MTPKEIVLNNVIGLNPTGMLNFSDTYTMMGSNSVVLNPNSASENSLKKSTQNQIVCDNIENFANYNSEKKNNKIVILIILFLIILLILYFFINR